MTDQEWAIIEPLLASPARLHGGRPPKHSLRLIVDAVRYLVRSGAAWRLLPGELPPWQTVYWWFAKWSADALFSTACFASQRDLPEGVFRQLTGGFGSSDSSAAFRQTTWLTGPEQSRSGRVSNWAFAFTNGGVMQPVDQLAQMASDINVRRVFGESYERDGVTIIPVATVRGGGGIGRREQPGEEARKGNQGGGLGLVARPAGVYVLKDGKVRWVPAIDVNRAILGGQVVAIAIILLLRRAMAPKMFRRRRGPLPPRLTRFLSRRSA